MAKGWTAERRSKQSAAIQSWRPWDHSTGPRTPDGKKRVAQHAYKGGVRDTTRLLGRLLRRLHR